MHWMSHDLPTKFEDLIVRESTTGSSLRKRSKDEETKVEPTKPSIRDRIKVRDDAKDKKIKVAGIATDKVEEKTKVEGEETEKPKKDPAKVRCGFWPSCKKPECPFVHPKEAVFLKVSQVPKMRLWQQVYIHSPISKFCSRSLVGLQLTRFLANSE